MSSEKENLDGKVAENQEDKPEVEESTAEAKSKSQNEEVAEEMTEKTTELDKLKAEKTELQDKYVRLYSEFDNFRRRTAKEKLDLIHQANSELITELLGIIDDFERGLDSMEKAEDKEALVKGVELIYHKFNNLLNKKGVSLIDAHNQPFDVDFHEALTKIPAPNPDMKGKVIDVIEKGYMLKDKVVRHAKVVVAE